MENVTHPPDAILWAYSRLLDQVFLYLRNASHGIEPITAKQLFDLGDALHNISGILSGYGSWIDDENYRQLYLRPYDRCWASVGFGLEAFLDGKITEFMSMSSTHVRGRARDPN
jgi:hypothetical protein